MNTDATIVNKLVRAYLSEIPGLSENITLDLPTPDHMRRVWRVKLLRSKDMRSLGTIFVDFEGAVDRIRSNSLLDIRDRLLDSN